MAFWPRDDRTKNKPSAKRHGLAKEENRDYPYLEPGLIGAATLLEDKTSRLDWTFLTKPPGNKDDSLEKRLKFGRQIHIFPPTQAIPVQTVPTSIQQHAEQGANFLRTYLPYVEITSELIRDQLVEDTTLSRELELFDPHLGNLLEIFEPADATGISFFIFPTGEINRNLSICPINYSDTSDVVFKPSSTPAYMFPTPIQQLVLSGHHEARDVNVAIRTFGCVKLLGLDYSTASQGLSFRDLATLSRADTDNETIVDMKHLPSSAGMMTAGNKGTIFECNVANGAKIITRLYEHDKPTLSTAGDHDFWRLALDSNPCNYFLMSSKKLVQLDNRTRSSGDTFSIRSGKHVLTSIEDVRQNNILQLCSTNDILWLDTRFLKKPLLAYAHGREFDRYLATNTLINLQHPLTFLSTRNNELVTVYDVSSSSESLVRLNCPPYLLSSTWSVHKKHVGQQFVFCDNHLGLARVSERGGVSYSELLLPDLPSDQRLIVDMPKDLQELGARIADLQADVGPLGHTNFSQVDLRPAYDALFREHFEEMKALEDESAESIYQMLDYFPSYMQNKELPIEYIMTTYDIAFRAGDEPDHASRADFLTQSIVNSTRGYRALKQGRLASQLVKAPWHRSIAPILQCLDKDFQADPQKLTEYLQTFNLSDEGRSSQFRKHEINACQQLTLDLILSSDIYSESLSSKPGEVDQTLEVMTEALSLSDEPPPVEFGYLKPLERRSGLPGMEGMVESEPPELPMGVRLLLKGWDTADPEEYVYKDSYNGPHIMESWKPAKLTPVSQLRDFIVQSQRPPAIMATSTVASGIPEIPRRMVPKVQSQDPFKAHSDAAFRRSEQPGKSLFDASQELAVSTQVLPGPYGGRPAAKKRPAKKRLGGF